MLRTNESFFDFSIESYTKIAAIGGQRLAQTRRMGKATRKSGASQSAEVFALPLLGRTVERADKAAELFGGMACRESQPKARRSSAYAWEANRRNKKAVFLNLLRDL